MDPQDGPDRRSGGRRLGRRVRRSSESTPPPAAPSVADGAELTAATGEDPIAGSAGDGGEERTARAVASFQQLLDQSPVGMVIVDADARVILHNDAAATLLDTHHEDLVNGRFQLAVDEQPYELVRRDADGLGHTLAIESSAFAGFDTPAWVVTIRDTLAAEGPDDDVVPVGAGTHDALTGLPGRELFLNHVFETARRSRSLDTERFAVAVIDLEQFDLVNQAHGRAAGDRVLQVVATRLTSAVRPGDYVSRTGGDEFAIVLPAQPLAGHLAITDRIEEVLSQPITLDGVDIYCSPAVGLAEHVDEDDELTVLARAEQSLIASAPGATQVAARPSEHDTRRAQPSVTTAVSEGQMFLHYQPIFSVEANLVIGLEALVRWEHPDDGLIAPDEFIRIAEENGGIVPLGEWVIAEVCEQIESWATDMPDFLIPPVSINVSARQLRHPELHDHVRAELAKRNLDPGAVRFEITEGVLLDSDPRVQTRLREFADLGIGLVLDEYGTGLSSLTQLQQFPLVGVKIDRSYVTRMMTDEPSAQMVLAVIDAARAFDLSATAIGVETAEQKAVLVRWGCAHAQGYLLARPMSPMQASRFFGRDPDSMTVRPGGPLLRSSGTYARPAV